MEGKTYPVDVRLPEVPVEVYDVVKNFLTSLLEKSNVNNITAVPERTFLVITNYLWYIDQYLYTFGHYRYAEIGTSLRNYGRKNKIICARILKDCFNRDTELFYKWINIATDLTPLSMYDMPRRIRTWI